MDIFGWNNIIKYRKRVDKKQQVNTVNTEET
jgi:hypothetical protein